MRGNKRENKRQDSRPQLRTLPVWCIGAMVLVLHMLDSSAHANASSAQKKPAPDMVVSPLELERAAAPSTTCLAWAGPVGGQRKDRDGQYRFAAAVTEADYDPTLLSEQRRNGRTIGWRDGGLNQQGAWQILTWVWACGALVAAFVYVTYRNLALRQMQQLSGPPPSVPGLLKPRCSSSTGQRKTPGPRSAGQSR